MPPSPTVSKDEVINAAVELVRAGGLESVNARSLAAALGCSTRPLFRLYHRMDDLKQDVVAELNRIYNAFMDTRMTDDDRLASQGAAYVEFARCEPRIFDELFMNRCMEGASLAEVAAAPWNQATIENVRCVWGMTRADAEAVFINVWLFSHGLATQIASNHVDIDAATARRLIEDACSCFAAPAHPDAPGLRQPAAPPTPETAAHPASPETPDC